MHVYSSRQKIDCTYSYGALDQVARKINVAKFRANKTSVLLVTDVAARGIDIPLLDYVSRLCSCLVACVVCCCETYICRAQLCVVYIYAYKLALFGNRSGNLLASIDRLLRRWWG